MLTRGGEGVKNHENLADVIYERPLKAIPPSSPAADSGKHWLSLILELGMLFKSSTPTKMIRTQSHVVVTSLTTSGLSSRCGMENILPSPDGRRRVTTDHFLLFLLIPDTLSSMWGSSYVQTTSEWRTISLLFPFWRPSRPPPPPVSTADRPLWIGMAWFWSGHPSQGLPTQLGHLKDTFNFVSKW